MNLNEQLRQAYEDGRRQALNENVPVPPAEVPFDYGPTYPEGAPGPPPGYFYDPSRDQSVKEPVEEPVKPGGYLDVDDGVITPNTPGHFGNPPAGIQPDGTYVSPDGTVTKPDGTVVLPDNGGVLMPDGTFVPGWMLRD